MRVEDFRYELPEELIAQYPTAERRGSRLLSLPGAEGAPLDRDFSELPELLDPGDLLVFNDTRVIPARLHGRKASGGRIELLVERVLDDRRLLAQLRVSKKPRAESELVLDGGARARVLGRHDELFEIGLSAGESVAALLAEAGQVPLPPYIRRAPEDIDTARYQTVYARRDGAVAAPTAGLHFDEEMLDELDRRRVERVFVTLHVGAGTFQPVRVEQLEDHVMHAERVEVSATVCARVAAARARGGRVVAVGTTAVRSLEAAAAGGALAPFDGETRIFIYPGFRFRCVDALLTNFHMPRSTLLMLVCAFAGRERVLDAYRHAVRERYRFFSYGDAMLMGRAER